MIEKVYRKLPKPIQYAARYAYSVIPPPIRYGKVFRETYAFLQESQWWSKEQLEEYQLQQLSKLLHHAYENVPYYHRVFDERGLKPKDIKNFDDLQKLPYLTKNIIRENLADLIAQNYPKSKLHYVTTGGSTGTPLGFYWEKGVTDAKEWAFMWRGWNWAGFKFGEKRVILRRNIINRFKDNKRQWWEYCPVEHALILSSFDMTDENLPKYAEKINEFRPLAIEAYPSSLYTLVNFFKNNNFKIENLKCILTGSETLYPHQRKVIEGYLGIKIFDHYGNTETNALIAQCEKGNYHIISEYGFVELIGKDGNPVNEEGEVGEIIATGFNNYAMPFIRYKTRDIAVYSREKCSCGKNYPTVKKIEGRLQDFIVSKSGHLIPLTAIKYDALEENNFARQFQFYQDKPGVVGVYIVKTRDFSEKEKNSILRSLHEGVEKKVEFYIRFVVNIPRTKSGKYRFLVQKLPIEFGDS